MTAGRSELVLAGGLYAKFAAEQSAKSELDAVSGELAELQLDELVAKLEATPES